MSRTAGRAVIVGARMDWLGAPAVTTDDAQALRLAVEYLHARGHRQIGLICNDPTDPIALRQIDAWRTCCGMPSAADRGREVTEPTDGLLIAVRTASYACLRTTAYDVVRAFLRSDISRTVTAIIVLVDEMVAPTLAACRDEGRSVPDTMSLIGLGGDNALFDFSQPPVTSVDVDIEGHVVAALAFIDAAENGTLLDDDRLRMIEPRLIERQSVATV
jgi:LacI family repressor for deo operon, udp, cdd, tsx, nupC, and nupG